MFTKNILKIAFTAAILYLIFLAIFAFNSHYENIVLLYIGNGLFFLSILSGLIWLNKMAGGNASTRVLFKTGVWSLIHGVAVATVLGIILFYIQKGNYVDAEMLEDLPAQGGDIHKDDMFLNIIINSAVLNPILGFFATILGSGVIKKNQKSGSGRETVQ
ncbi:hypothetical protein [Parasegetibacter sp. NRK P23]|uniref:hypothetical protein n=1 Tax=Parasegetibacter sp. NRK P23 TaxID=2942999 RepID=UPI0020440DCC|nr:hypothetical protein [Parasegetibacter sp. NRK P23]MCM5529847.1 hypothetical protein [Parasegetibacter sp. NRK P23]